MEYKKDPQNPIVLIINLLPQLQIHLLACFVIVELFVVNISPLLASKMLSLISRVLERL